MDTQGMYIAFIHRLHLTYPPTFEDNGYRAVVCLCGRLRSIDQIARQRQRAPRNAIGSVYWVRYSLAFETYNLLT